ncbi:hypothetical protein J4H56_10145 [Vibrio alginolyticus]|uniref:hypothetical protein n=1 Tax=Vibrio alginolyticus TaxID=663 RepID=UPI0010BD6BC6|nr:hypothetical protein [Vibrio alginolyticus]ELN6884636.1 hypothetical protein [Vibrio alginolyticus]MBS9882961.1 hypothetical protein [Vibrio alginolyticus]MBT0000458.1 hypothetical protein [Vibrio alginolyticus]MCZ6398592.1 hypothetical protein [Vibrio alginolyticus]TKF07667.1 hypothetical protein FCV48_16095 [Vibrio alginolyticus]
MKLLQIAAVSAALVAGFYAPTLIKSFSSPTQSKSIDEYCFLSTTSCVQENVTMTLNSETAQPLVPTTLNVEWHTSDAKQLILSLSGREMEMGEPKFLLKQIAPGQYQGDIILPVCTEDAMTWVGELSDGENTVYPAIKMQR